MTIWCSGLVSVIPVDNQRIESIIPPRRESKVLTNGECKYEIRIPPFAMSTYKMNGAFWINPKTVDHEMMVSYQRAAWFWLREHKFSHRDYNFFVSHGIWKIYSSKSCLTVSTIWLSSIPSQRGFSNEWKCFLRCFKQSTMTEPYQVKLIPRETFELLCVLLFICFYNWILPMCCVGFLSHVFCFLHLILWVAVARNDFKVDMLPFDFYSIERFHLYPLTKTKKGFIYTSSYYCLVL